MQRATVLLLLIGLGAASVRAQVCQTYIVQAGDSIASISEQFSVTQGALEEALGKCIIGYAPGAFLQPSQTICLPTWYDACNFVSVSGEDTDCKYYTVQAGDTLSGIAMALGLTQMDLEAVNPDALTLQPNTFVKLTGWNDACPAPGNTLPCRVYTATGGDSLASIAMAFSLELPSLQEVNPSLDNNTVVILQPGERVLIPPFTENCGEGVEVEKPSSGMCNAYEVVGGDTLFTIATAFKTSADQLLLINPELAAGGTLSPGVAVFLPPHDEAACVAGTTFITAEEFAIAKAEMAPAPAPEPAAFLRRRVV